MIPFVLVVRRACLTTIGHASLSVCKPHYQWACLHGFFLESEKKPCGTKLFVKASDKTLLLCTCSTEILAKVTKYAAVDSSIFMCV